MQWFEKAAHVRRKEGVGVEFSDDKVETEEYPVLWHRKPLARHPDTSAYQSRLSGGWLTQMSDAIVTRLTRLAFYDGFSESQVGLLTM